MVCVCVRERVWVKRGDGCKEYWWTDDGDDKSDLSLAEIRCSSQKNVWL